MNRLPDQAPTPRTVFVLCAVVAVVLTYVAVEAAPAHLARPTPTPGPSVEPSYDNGYEFAASHAEVAPTLAVDGGWVSFLWHGEKDKFAFNQEGAFEFHADGPVALRITDDFCTGDQFRIYDNGVELGSDDGKRLGRPTFDVAKSGGMNLVPGDAFADPQWSSGIYQLAPGDHEIVVQVIANPFAMGRAYLRVDSVTPFATFDLDLVSSIINAVHGRDRFRFYGRWASAAGSDGVEPALEDVVLWYGRVLEVVPAGAFTCDAVQCIYESDGPGIVRAVVDANGLLFEAEGVDLCPGERPLRIGLWFGNEGTDRAVRCHGILSNPDP